MTFKENDSVQSLSGTSECGPCLLEIKGCLS